MEAIAAQLETHIHYYIARLREIPEQAVIDKPSPAKWSKKEITGHLIDSAQNNIRRFVVAQYENEPYIVYNQDQWVLIAGYQDYNWPDLVELWYLLNKHIVVILENMNSLTARRVSRSEDVHTLEWLAQDYIRHLQHHLHQVLDLEPVAYP